MDAYELSHPILSAGAADRNDERLPEVVPLPIERARRYVDQLPRQRLRARLVPVVAWEPREARAAVERALGEIAVANGLVLDLDESALVLADRLRGFNLISPPAADATAVLLRLLTPPASELAGQEPAALARRLVTYLEGRARPAGSSDRGNRDFSTRRRPSLWTAS